jgi:hypothetical protein
VWKERRARAVEDTIRVVELRKAMTMFDEWGGGVHHLFQFQLK